jgi:hypothetical protein
MVMRFAARHLCARLAAAHAQLGAPMVLVWDNLPAHRARLTQKFIAAHVDWLTVFPMPSYAPELSPARGCGRTSRAGCWSTRRPRPGPSGRRRQGRAETHPVSSLADRRVPDRHRAQRQAPVATNLTSSKSVNVDVEARVNPYSVANRCRIRPPALTMLTR